MAKFTEFETLTIGDTKISYIPDGGCYIIPTQMYSASDAADWQEKYKDHLDENGDLMITLGGFLIERGDRKIVIDLGYGPNYAEFPGFSYFFGGNYLENFKKTGVKREEVTDVIYTHLHLDHVGWTTVATPAGRQLTFPNAKHYCSEAEWEGWKGDTTGFGPDPVNVREPLESVIQFISDGDEIMPGFKVLAVPGHTFGLLSFMLECGDRKVYFIADMAHSDLQFAEEGWSAVFDLDPENAAKRRGEKYDLIRGKDTIIADGHFTGHAFGTFEEKNGSFSWQLVDPAKI